jgi:hypothetical protein
MKITPKTDQELASMNLIQPGQYPFEVIVATDKVSKSGNEMIELKLKIWDENNKERVVFDYLLDSMFHKIKHFCEITGLIDKYNSESLLASHCLGKSGYLDLAIQKDKSGIYGDKNSVKDYVVTISSEPKKEDEFINDQIPF